MKKGYLGSLVLAALLFATSCAPNVPAQNEPLPETEQIPPVAASQTVPPQNYVIVSELYDENGYRIRYPQIAGLTDAAQQGMINERIKDGALMGLRYYEYVMPEDEVLVEIDYWVSYSDLNLISIVYSGVGNVVGAAHPSNLFYTSNLRMSNGESIRLADFIDVNTEVAQKLIAGGFRPAKKECSAEYAQELGFFTADEWTKRLADADPENDIGSEYSYFTEKSLGISVAVAHVMGDHAEFEIPYGDIWNSIKAKDDTAYATLVSSVKTSIPASTSSLVPQPTDANNQIIVITNITPREGEYWVDAAIQELVTIDPAKLEAMRANKSETIEINEQLYYFVDEAAYRTLQPAEPRTENAIGVLYSANEKPAGGDIWPTFSVGSQNETYGVYHYGVGSVPYRQAGNCSYPIASDAKLEVITLGVSRADMKYVEITPDAFYELYRSLGKEDASGYYRSGFFGAGFLCDVKEGKIVRLHENYMP